MAHSRSAVSLISSGAEQQMLPAALDRSITSAARSLSRARERRLGPAASLTNRVFRELTAVRLFPPTLASLQLHGDTWDHFFVTRTLRTAWVDNVVSVCGVAISVVFITRCVVQSYFLIAQAYDADRGGCFRDTADFTRWRGLLLNTGLAIFLLMFGISCAHLYRAFEHPSALRAVMRYFGFFLQRHPIFTAAAITTAVLGNASAWPMSEFAVIPSVPVLAMTDLFLLNFPLDHWGSRAAGVALICLVADSAVSYTRTTLLIGYSCEDPLASLDGWDAVAISVTMVTVFVWNAGLARINFRKAVYMRQPAVSFVPVAEQFLHVRQF
jgi:hypothetical protein